jgi:hypothetical protein
MQEKNGHKIGRDKERRFEWMPEKNGGQKRSTSFVERPIPKPTTDLGFTGIRHKTSGRSLSQPSRSRANQ